MRPSRFSPRSRTSRRDVERGVSGDVTDESRPTVSRLLSRLLSRHGLATKHAFGPKLALVLALFGGAACDDKKPVPMASDAAPAPSTPVMARAIPSHPPVPHDPAAAPPSPRVDGPCRILEAAGPIGLSTALGPDAGLVGADAGAPRPVRAGALIPRGALIELGKDAIATVKDPESGREIRFEGPARAVPCAGTDEAWLIQGTLVMRPGTADSPLSELAVVVREGVVRLAAGAVVRVEALKSSTNVTSRARRPAIWSAKDSKIVWERPDAGPDAGASEVGTWTVPAASASAATATVECEALGRESRDLANKMLAKDAPMSELSPKSLEVSRSERAACAVAKLRALH